MPTITINDKACDFEAGQTVLQVANENGIEIPQYCYHDGLSRPAQCRICLAEMWGPNPRNDNKVEPIAGGKLMPTCTTEAADGMVVRADSPKSVANQRAVMEYLLINHPLDCPVCDQAGECFLQDYSYKYGRGVSRFEESKVKQAKKDLGPHVYIYADRCILCTRCVRFAREVSGTAELTIDGRGNQSQIDVFPGVALDNELSANVIDICPVGALLDKDFLFAQRVWFLKSTPSIDGITASGDNILIEHNEGQVYRVRPRTNLAVNKWWITDEVRYGWKFVHDERRLNTPLHRRYGTLVETDWARAYDDAVDGLRNIAQNNGRLLAMISPMLSCEDAYTLASFVRTLDSDAILAVGPVPVHGEDKAFPVGSEFDDPDAFRMYAEKAPNARGVRRVLAAFGGDVIEYDEAINRLGHGSGESDIAGALITGNYPSDWSAPELKGALAGKFNVLIDTLPTDLIDEADIVLPGSTFAEKAGTFENARHMLQGFEQAIPPIEGTKPEAQIGLDLQAILDGGEPAGAATKVVSLIDEGPGQVPQARTLTVSAAQLFNAANARQAMAERFEALALFTTDVSLPAVEAKQEADMQMVEL